MSMAGDNDKGKKGFSGLSDLASQISGLDDTVGSKAISETKLPHGTQGQKGTPGSEPKSEPTTSPPPIETVSSGKSGRGSGWKWFLGIVGVIVVIWIANNWGQNTKKPSPNTPSPTHNTYESRPSRSILAREIETGKMRAKQMEIQIRNMDDRLEEYKRRLDNYKSLGMIDEYNELVLLFNALVNERNNLYEDYSRLIDEVNAKVKRYNSGYR